MTTMNERADAVIVAAGRGHRAGGDIPKQYRDLAGQAVLRRTVQAFLGHPRIGRVQVVIHPDDRALYDDCVTGLGLPSPVNGGATRQESVRAGLEALNGEPPGCVLIHDAARPFIEAAVISRVIDSLAAAPAALAAAPVADTLKRAENGRAMATVARDGLWRAQTPQGFRFETILALHRAAAETGDASATDDAALAEQAGLAVQLIECGEGNVKITTADDLERAARRTAAETMWETRIGTGFDVHAFGPGDHVIVCGVEIAHSRALTGHSDADVGLHALTDAILGAIGAGDIGQHFPPSDPQWKGAASDQFLAHAARLVRRGGGRIINVDVTLICEEPKMGPHRAAMTARIADILGIGPDRVGVKATTTERLGFPGRGEGIAAQAGAAVALPVSADQGMGDGE